MTNSTIIRNAIIINENTRTEGDIFIKNGIIEKISDGIYNAHAATEIDANGKWLLPGVIDDQVHFREPGLTHKGCIHSEARAGVAGGVTTFMEMPNTNPRSLYKKLCSRRHLPFHYD